MTKYSTTTLLLFLLLCGVVSVRAQTGDGTSVVDTSSTSGGENHKVIVYYLYFMPRCETCLNMEAYSKEAVETGFANDLKQGTVEWHSYNTDKEEYKHFWDDFKLETKSLVMVDMQDGKQVRWKNCEKIWDLVGVKPDFLKYVQDEVHSYLAKNE
jgi:hypothetical protein